MQHALLFFFSLCCSFCVAQNLVYNGSFEEYTTCPSSNSEVENCVGWFSASNSPDYFNACAPSLSGQGVSVPANTRGYQYPYEGNAYMGGFTYSKVDFPTTEDYRECIRGILTEPLIVGTKYYVSFKVSLAGNAMIYGNNKLGALFTNMPYSSYTGNPAPISNYAHIYTNTIITDTANWITVSGSFVADSAYRYVMIGNFFDNSLTDTLALLPYWNQPSSYYYIDNVCVSTDSVLCIPITDCNFVLPTAFTPNGDNLNDEYKCVTNCSSVETFSMRIYNRWGQLVFETHDSNQGWDGTCKSEPQSTDVYMVCVLAVSGGKTYAKSASITLIR